ncbi:MAG: proprotein convertase P-domain-containing protein [Bacteroidota bacterium]|nr:proprotein convertase P-domain-containing protein [Bacteroidota bacterium]
MKKKIYKLIAIAFILVLCTKENATAQMFWNNAGSFEGTTSSYVAVPSSPSLDITGSFTLEAWIRPDNITLPTTPIIVGKGVSPRYDLRLTSTVVPGKVAVRTNGVTKLISKTSVTSGNWTHVAATFNSVSDVFSIYLNGSLDTSVTIVGAEPTANSDSLLIGKGFNSPFDGQLDEVRIWNTALTLGQVVQYRRTSLGTSSGIYDALVMSITFQDNDNNGSSFNLTDWSGNANTGFNKGITAVDLSDRPLQTISINESIELNGVDEYLAAPDNNAFSPPSELTLEAWIFPRSFDKNNIIIHKGTPDGAMTDYNLMLIDGRLNATVNNINKFTSDDLIPLNQWSHVAFNYDGPNGFYTFFLNGEIIDAGVNNKGFIIDGSDSLYIGGTIGLTDFDGFIDEVRITSDSKYINEINKFLFQSIDESNDGPAVAAVYNFDGYAVSNVGAFNRLYFRNGANFSHSGTINNQPLSPLNRDDGNNFQDGFYIKTSDRRIPASGTSGLMDNDSLNVLLNETITDVNVFVAINHTAEQNLSITLTAPNGESVIMFNANPLVTNSDNMVTIFDDQADSSIVNGRYVSFGPVIKPVNNLNTIFSGDNTFGKWRLVINDLSASDTGRLYGWGIQFNNRTSKPMMLSSRALVQGFYNPSANLMVRDTMRFYLREIVDPFTKLDSAKAYLNTDGSAILSFNNGDLLKDINLYIQLYHRNSIETWSSTGIVFDALTSQAQYDFTASASQAFGDNMIQVDTAPNEFAIYGADVNQDGSVDLADLTSIDNDAFGFVSGYVLTDVNGDNAVDLADATIADNNAFNFVNKVVP